jgi:hypothetical protein
MQEQHWREPLEVFRILANISFVLKLCFALFFSPPELLLFKASFVSTGSIPIGMGKYNKKIMIATIRDPDLFRVEN